jgi:hypothetical protein
MAVRFEVVGELLAQLDAQAIWEAATPSEQRIFVEELLSEFTMFPDHLEVEVAGVPRLNVLLGEVGLSPMQSVGVRGGT